MRPVYRSQNIPLLQDDEPDYSGCRFIDCTFDGSVGFGRCFSNATFADCRINEADWYGASFNGATFERCELSNVDFRGASFLKTVFKDCRLIGCDFSHNNMGRDTKIEEITFTGCHFEGCVKRDFGSIHGNLIAIVGTLEFVSREHVEELIGQAGGKIARDVMDHPHLVLAGPNAGDDLAFARNRGIRVVDEKTFLVMLRPEFDPNHTVC